jgi:hypothetical protein
MLGMDSFEVILAGKFTPAQELALRKRHRCDPNVIHKMLTFLRAINPLYEKAPGTAVEDIPSSASQIITELPPSAATDALIARARARARTRTRAYDDKTITIDTEGGIACESAETNIQHSDSILFNVHLDEQPDVATVDAIVRLIGPERLKGPRECYIGTFFLLEDLDTRKSELTSTQSANLRCIGWRSQGTSLQNTQTFAYSSLTFTLGISYCLKCTSRSALIRRPLRELLASIHKICGWNALTEHHKRLHGARVVGFRQSLHRRTPKCS